MRGTKCLELLLKSMIAARDLLRAVK